MFCERQSDTSNYRPEYSPFLPLNAYNINARARIYCFIVRFRLPGDLPPGTRPALLFCFSQSSTANVRRSNNTRVVGTELGDGHLLRYENLSQNCRKQNYVETPNSYTCGWMRIVANSYNGQPQTCRKHDVIVEHRNRNIRTSKLRTHWTMSRTTYPA